MAQSTSPTSSTSRKTVIIRARPLPLSPAAAQDARAEPRPSGIRAGPACAPRAGEVHHCSTTTSASFQHTALQPTAMAAPSAISPQPQRVRNGGGMEPVEREIKAEQAEYGREHREQAAEHAEGAEPEADPFTDHGTPPPFSADCADRD